mmetsp:Transcript_24936/g.65759  ORF Transcript_24936/g.65759 Transcript_24936/m.65759 type:complete len:220 (+) Transcript_24936:262-921(+)
MQWRHGPPARARLSHRTRVRTRPPLAPLPRLDTLAAVATARLEARAAKSRRFPNATAATNPREPPASRKPKSGEANSACLLAVLLLDPASDVEAPRVGHQQGAENIPGVDRAAAQDVQQVGLRNAVHAKDERKERRRPVDHRRHVLANAEDDGVRVLLVAPPHVLRLQLHSRGDAQRRRRADSSRPQAGSRRERGARAEERKEEELHHGCLEICSGGGV